tara:strand:- start:366 stop:560 length:195 start_codon:yes stop_codon:yes gene_type:complete
MKTEITKFMNRQKMIQIIRLDDKLNFTENPTPAETESLLLTIAEMDNNELMKLTIDCLIRNNKN